MTKRNDIAGANAAQFLRYLAVGVLNTVVTLVVIYVLKSFTPTPRMLCNAIGYIAGVVNSFLWNRAWVFRATDGNGARQAVRFVVGFGICYGLQFLVVWGLLHWEAFATISINVTGFEISGYGIATLIGMGVYTVANFIFNKLIAFK